MTEMYDTNVIRFYCCFEIYSCKIVLTNLGDFPLYVLGTCMPVA